jgi:hypothetical protein
MDTNSRSVYSFESNMETQWIQLVESLTDRLRRNDETLTHLQPYPVTEEQPGRVWSASALFHTAVLLDDSPVEAALGRLWDAVREHGNKSSVRRVTLPASWPTPDLKRALVAIGHLEGLQEVDIIAENASQMASSAGNVFGRRSQLAGWHASPLDLADFLPFLSSSRGLKRLNIDCRVMVLSQLELDQLGRLLVMCSHVRTLALRFVQKRAGVRLTLDPVLEALAQCSDTGSLDSISLHWYGDLASAQQQAAVSDTVLEQLLSSTNLRVLHMHGFYLGEAHMHAVARALGTKIVLQDLRLYDHNMRLQDGGVTAESLRVMKNVLKHENYTLQRISLFTRCEDEPDRPTSRLSVLNLRPSGVLRSDAFNLDSDEEDEEADSRCYRLQYQMNILCRLNRLGRASLMTPSATPLDWITVMALCSERGTATARSSSTVRQYLEGSLSDTGLNEIFTLLRTQPSLCNGGQRTQSLQVPEELAVTRGRVYEGNSFKDFTAPSTTVTKALSIGWRKKRRESQQQQQR